VDNDRSLHQVFYGQDGDLCDANEEMVSDIAATAHLPSDGVNPSKRRRSSPESDLSIISTTLVRRHDCPDLVIISSSPELNVDLCIDKEDPDLETIDRGPITVHKTVPSSISGRPSLITESPSHAYAIYRHRFSTPPRPGRGPLAESSSQQASQRLQQRASQFVRPQQSSPGSAESLRGLLPMLFSPQKRGTKYLSGGLAETVREWALEVGGWWLHPELGGQGKQYVRVTGRRGRDGSQRAPCGTILVKAENQDRTEAGWAIIDASNDSGRSRIDLVQPGEMIVMEVSWAIELGEDATADPTKGRTKWNIGVGAKPVDR